MEGSVEDLMKMQKEVGDALCKQLTDAIHERMKQVILKYLNDGGQ